ncbi:hypothetical protein T265_00008 [Opisthorchis viverrini]|uniref:Uncharacterized protein n=1 Tax=Opisthorchis viverrini TaxID=6198 RepID=A0A075ADC6_OPIVI|nr:hypothetical protein T265_00008 [Opisthorchis viverrini]KER34120.1 hypothetical protein T265_00008 [Opisthorchis viverrini]
MSSDFRRAQHLPTETAEYHCQKNEVRHFDLIFFWIVTADWAANTKRLTWNPAESLVCEALRQLDVLQPTSSCFSRYDIRDIATPVAPFRYLVAMLPEGGTRAGILPGYPSLNKSSRNAEIGLKPRTFRSKFCQPLLRTSVGKTYINPRWTKWLEHRFTDQKFRGSNPTSASRLPLSKFGRPGIVPGLPTTGFALLGTHQVGAVPELPSTLFYLKPNCTKLAKYTHLQNWLHCLTVARETATREQQAGFWQSRGCVDQIFTHRQMLERHSYTRPTIIVFLDFQCLFCLTRLSIKESL